MKIILISVSVIPASPHITHISLTTFHLFTDTLSIKKLTERGFETPLTNNPSLLTLSFFSLIHWCPFIFGLFYSSVLSIEGCGYSFVTFSLHSFTLALWFSSLWRIFLVLCHQLFMLPCDLVKRCSIDIPFLFSFTCCLSASSLQPLHFLPVMTDFVNVYSHTISHLSVFVWSFWATLLSLAIISREKCLSHLTNILIFFHFQNCLSVCNPVKSG